ERRAVHRALAGDLPELHARRHGLARQGPDLLALHQGRGTAGLGGLDAEPAAAAAERFEHGRSEIERDDHQHDVADPQSVALTTRLSAPARWPGRRAR